MQPLRYFFILMLLLPVTAQVTKPDVIQQLLDLPAPRPAPPPTPPPVSLQGFDANHPPPDDAPLELLEAYWSLGGPHPDKAKMPATLRQRFLSYAEQQPDKLVSLLEQELLPDTPDTHARVQALMDAGLASYHGQTEEKELRRHEVQWRAKLRDWLTLHSSFYLDDLEQQARTSKDENGEITAERPLRALARLDWERAQPLLASYAFSPQLRTAALALTLLYGHAVASNSNEAAALRARLQTIIANPQMPGRARHLACQSLMQTKWDGREEWFLSLFADDSLRVMEDGGSGTLYPLNQPVQSNPEHWIPLLTKLVGHSNPAIHEAAVDCLASFDPAAPRQEVLQALLPWLANPNWSTAEGRKELLQGLKNITLPDAVPGLLWVVENDEDEELRLLAVEALAVQRDQRAVVALKRMLAQVTGPRERAVVAEALVACGGLRDAEIARAIEAYATRVTLTGKGDLAAASAELDLDFDLNVPLQIALGKALSETETPREAVATRLLDRIQQLERRQPMLARLLLTIVQKWNLRIVDANRVERIATGKADLNELQTALNLRARLRQSVRDELQTIALRRDAAAGIATAILADENLFYKIMGEDDKAAQRALLAAARLTRTPLPLARVGEWLDDQTLRQAAERYLISEDSPEARRLVLAKHPGAALILGVQAEANDKPTPGAAMFTQWEKKLQAEVLAQDGAEEIIALLSSKTLLQTTTHTTATGTITSTRIADRQVVIRVRRDKAELVWRTDEARENVRELTAAEWNDLQMFLVDRNIDALPPRSPSLGTAQNEHEFLRLTKHGGRRLHIANLNESSGNQDVYSLLLRQFRLLTESREFRLRYDLQTRVKGMEVVLADEQYPLSGLCGSNGKVLVQIVTRSLLTIHQKDTVEMIGREAEWYELDANKLGAKVEPPKTCGPPALSSAENQTGNPAQDLIRKMNSTLGAAFGNYIVRANEGIARFSPLAPSEVLFPGKYQDVLESSDGKWLLAVKETAAGAQSLVRIELATRKETPITFVFTGKVKLFAVIPGINKFVFRQQHTETESQGFLVTPTTGAVEPIKGNAGPLSRRPPRDFQPTGNPDEVWAATSNPNLRVTEIGRYNLKTFSFTPMKAIPELSFTSDALWVDEAARQIYVAYRGHLLRFPFAP